MWHASAAVLLGFQTDQEKLRRCALVALIGVGDETLGQWEEWTGRAYHIRRRLTLLEQKGIGDVKDIRGTAEQERRYQAVRPFLPFGYRWKD